MLMVKQEMKKIATGYPIRIVAITIVYFVAARLGLMLAYPETNATPIWLPTGIALSAVLLLGNRIWPSIALGAFIANFEQLAGLGLSVPVSLAASFCTSAGNTLEALAGAYLIHRFTETRNPFEKSADVLAFIAFGAMISTAISATIGTATFCFSISEWGTFVSIWLTWWLGDAVGAIVLVPLIMTYTRFEDAEWGFWPMAANLLIMTSIVAVSYIVFFMSYPLDFLLVPVLIISAFRLGQFGSAIAICIISGLSIYSTVNGIGIFAAKTPNESLLLQQGFIGSIAIATMVLAAIVSEQKKSQPKLLESERKYRELVENANSIILRWSRDGKITFLNKFGLKFFGYTQKEILGRHVVGTIVPETESTGRDLRPLMDKICADPKDFENNINENMRRNGERVWISWTNKTVLDKQGQVIEVLSIGSDITEHRKLEGELKKYREHLEELVQNRTKDVKDAQNALVNLLEEANEAKSELEQANEKLKELDRLKSMFIASMSHELRTPLNSIIGFTGIMLQGLAGGINDEQRDQLGRVRRAGRHLLALITDVIDVSKIEAGKVAVHTEVCDMAGVIGEAVAAIRPEADKKELTIEMSVPQDVFLMTDRRRLLQCVLNLLSNAVKYTERGSVHVAVRMIARNDGREEDGRWTKDDGGGKKDVASIVKGSKATGRPSSIVISVTDTGIGIADADLPLLFDSFVRLESHLKIKTHGTGLGLYLTKKIATELLGGEVFVESREGVGSTFGLKIPIGFTTKGV